MSEDERLERWCRRLKASDRNAYEQVFRTQGDALFSCAAKLVSLLLLTVLFAADDPVAYGQPEKAQRFTMVLRGVPLSQALEELVATTQISLAYDSELVRGERVFCSAEDASVEAVLQCILRGTHLDFYQTSSGTYVLTRDARQPPRRGHLAGVVVDRATGEPLPHANVLLADAHTGTATNKAGFFSFSSLLSGSHRIVATYVGYETAVDSVHVPPGGSVRQRIALRPKLVTAAPVVVNGLRQRLPSLRLGKGVLPSGRLPISGSMGVPDVARATGSLLGVHQQLPLADLHVQGGATGEHQTRLDGVPIRSPVTLGRLLGAFSPLALGRLTVYKAGFGAERGSLTSAVLSAEHRLAAPDDGLHAAVQIDPLSVNGRVGGRLPGAPGGTALIAARTGLPGLYRASILDHLLQRWHAVDPLLASKQAGEPVAWPMTPQRHRAGVDFSDVHGAARIKLGPFRTLSAFVYRGHNEIDSEFLAAAVPGAQGAAGKARRFMLTRDWYHWTSWAGQVRYEWMSGARTLGSLRAYSSRHRLGHGFQTARTTQPDSALPPGDVAARLRSRLSWTDRWTDKPYVGNRVREAGLEARLQYSLPSGHHLSGALKAVRVESQALINNGFFRSLAVDGASWQWASYFKDEISLGLQTILEAGTRLTYIPSRRTVYAEPRLSARHDGSHPALGSYAVRLAGGLYRQFVNRFDLSSAGSTALLPSIRFWLPAGASLAPPRAYHLSAEVMAKPAASWQVNLESYFKRHARLLALDYSALLAPDSSIYGPARSSDVIGATRGYAAGGGVRLRHTGEHYRGTLRYSYSYARRRFPSRFDGRLEPPAWNQPHRLSLEGRLSLAPSLALHLHWRGRWGRSWGFRHAYYDYLAPQQPAPDAYAPFDLSDPSRQALPPLYRLDLGLSYRHTWKGVSVQARAGLLNALDRQNVFDWSLRPAPGSGFEKAARYLPGRRPVFSLRVSY